MMNGKNGKTIHLMMTEVKVGDYTMPETKDQEDRTTYKHLRDHRCKGCASFNNYACNSTSFIMIDGKNIKMSMSNVHYKNGMFESMQGIY